MVRLLVRPKTLHVSQECRVCHERSPTRRIKSRIDAAYHARQSGKSFLCELSFCSVAANYTFCRGRGLAWLT